MAANRPDEAVSEFSSALAVKSDDAHIMCGMASAFASMAQWTAAQDWFERALRIEPDYAAAHYGLATALANEKQYDAAIKHLERALALDPSRTDAPRRPGKPAIAAQ